MATTITKEKARLSKLSDEGATERRRQLGEMSAGEIRTDLKKWKSDEWLGDDSGLLKAKVFNLFGLGEPPKKVWTKAGAVFMLDR